MDPIYLDHAATTPLRPEVRSAMARQVPAELGNPSSAHRRGRRAATILDEARARIAAALRCRPSEILFVRGGTESDNLALRGRWAAKAAEMEGSLVVHTSVEHPAVRETAEALEALGARREVVPVDRDGAPALDALGRLLDTAAEGAVAVVSMMWVNNEVGTVLPVPEAARLCAEHGVVLHTDAVQAVGKVPVRLDEVPVSLLTATGHKIGGPPGTGILFVREGTELAPVLTGGGQERGLRPGTQDVTGAVGMAEALELAVAEQDAEARRLEALRDALEGALREHVPGLRVHGGGGRRAPHILNVGIPGVDPATLVQSLDLEGVAASSGSACSSGARRAGPVLRALLGEDAEGAAPLRFSLGRTTTADQVREAAARTVAVVERLTAPDSPAASPTIQPTEPA